MSRSIYERRQLHLYCAKGKNMSQTHNNNQQPVSNQGQKKPRDRFFVFSSILLFVIGILGFGLDIWSGSNSWKSAAGSCVGLAGFVAGSYYLWFYSDK
jgi:hypothetical protein